jgi:alpha/beta superfamily hydrolase
VTEFVPSERCRIAGPAGSLEALCAEPAGGGDYYAVVCHPHPLYGGTMENKVVTTLARSFQECGMATVRFNFRGVNSSEGSYAEGRGETDDAVAVADWAASRWPGRRLVAAGFSFGAYIAWRLASLRPASRLVAIAPPVQRFDFSAVKELPPIPWLVVQGDADDVVDPVSVQRWAEASTPRPSFVMLPGVGHFFHGHLHELRDVVLREVRSG